MTFEFSSRAKERGVLKHRVLGGRRGGNGCVPSRYDRLGPTPTRIDVNEGQLCKAFLYKNSMAFYTDNSPRA